MTEPPVEHQRTLDVYIHIPKGAGTTLGRVLRSSAGPGVLRTTNVFKGEGGYDPEPSYERMIEQIVGDPDARVVTGHVPLGIAEHMPAEWKVRYFTFLRSPVERAISHYYEIVEAEKAGPRFAKDVEDAPLPSVVDVPYDEALSSGDFVLDNLQTRMLSGQSRPFGPVDEPMLDRALSNLERGLYFVGLTERFEESLVVLDRRLGYSAIPMDRKRVNVERPRGHDVPPELRGAAERENAMDAVLYERASELFSGYEELGEVDARVDVAALQHANASLEDLEPPGYFEGSPDAWALLLASRIEMFEARAERLRSRARIAELTADVDAFRAEATAARKRVKELRARLQDTAKKLDRTRERNRGTGQDNAL